MWLNLDSNLKENNLSILTVNTHSIIGKFADLVTNLKLVRKRFSFIIVIESLLTYDSNLFLDFDGYKSHSISRTGRKGGGIQLFYLDYIATEVISHLSVIEDSYESIFVKASILSLGNMYIAGICRPLIKPITDFTQLFTRAMEYTNRFHTILAGDFSIDVMET